MSLRRRMLTVDGPGRATLGVAAVFLAFALVGGRRVGLSWDENDHRRYGRWVVDAWYGAADAGTPTLQDMGSYGSLYGVLCALAEKVLPAGPIAIGHVITAIFATTGLVYAARLARAMAGPWAGLATAVILATTPRWTGHAMFNPVDIPFAAGWIAALFYLHRLLLRLPAPARADWVKLGLATGACLSVRIAGLLVPIFEVLALAAWVAWVRPPRTAIVRVALGAAAGAALTAVIVLALWPYLAVDPLRHPLEILGTSSKFPWQGAVLFKGRYYAGKEVPWTYLPTWFAITSPPAVFAGVISALFMTPHWVSPRREERVALAVLALSLVFPPCYAIARHATLYDGLRHFLFLVPGLAVLAGCGWAAVARSMETDRARAITAVALAALAVEPVVAMARTFPYSYVYFSPFAGGLAKASRGYETEYWGLSLREAAEWINANRVQLAGEDGTLVVVSNTGWHMIEPFLDEESRGKVKKGSDPRAFHVFLETYRMRPLGWHEQGRERVEIEKTLVKGAVPVWRIHRGPLALPPP